jgi:steroid delta-isomerase-like uncharacterized protein
MPMTVEDNKQLVRRFFDEIFNSQSALAAGTILSPEFVAHHPAFPEGIRGPDGIMHVTGMFRAGFPDLHYDIDDLVGEADRVAVRWTALGTHNGPFMGVPSSGRAVRVTGTDIFRSSNGQLVEAWVNSDLLGLMQQIGAIPAPPG